MKTLIVTVTGAAGQIAYSFLPRLGEILNDPEVKIDLRLLEIDQALPRLEGVIMELEDCALPFIESIRYGSSEEEMFDGTEMAVFIGAMPRGSGMQRSDLLTVNGAIFQRQGIVLNQRAASHVQALVVGNPCNANAYVLSKNAPDIPERQVFAMSMLDQNRAYGQIAKKTNARLDDIEDLCVWGNHSDTMFADFAQAKIYGKPLTEIVRDDEWLKGDFLDLVAKRGSAVIQARGSSSACSAANAAIDTLAWLMDKSPVAGAQSIGMVSQGEYGSQPGNVVSFPCQFDSEGQLYVVPDLVHDEFAQSRLARTFAELAEEVQTIHEAGLAT